MRFGYNDWFFIEYNLFGVYDLSIWWYYDFRKWMFFSFLIKICLIFKMRYIFFYFYLNDFLEF